MILATDPARPTIRIPTLVLAAIPAGSVAYWAYEWATHAPPHTVSDAAGSAVRWCLFCGLALAYLRLVYLRRTRLILDDAGVALTQPLASWRVAWTDIAVVTITGWLEVTHRGGSSRGVKLRLTDGTVRRIPDVFKLGRQEIAAVLQARRKGPG